MLKRITIDNSVRYVSKDGHVLSEQTPPVSKERKKNTSNEKLSLNNEKFIKNIKTVGIKVLKKVNDHQLTVTFIKKTYRHNYRTKEKLSSRGA